MVQKYVAEGILDHIPLLLTFPNYPRFASTFKYYDMWSKDSRLKTIVTEALMHKPRVWRPFRLSFTKTPSTFSCNISKRRNEGNTVNGFDKVAKVLTNFYKELLGEEIEERPPISQSIIDQGPIYYGFTGCIGDTSLTKTGGITNLCMTYVSTGQSFARSKRNLDGEASRGKNGSGRTTPIADAL
ncbi:hypothetical protein Cgig2_022412 [Carnegiea gigantea]|uniref:Uncharacterized protein n=1 Tax=Carnegiea gigantea TaxID=171969 RepID=A0A9Q1GG66_9CARY|nr:hypothetical protein Cgig2_022412 [Carnegiea gigantea]